jgi:hypothetical protein
MKPPEQHRFKPGQSGNPKGRPKRIEDPSTTLQKVLARRISVNGHAGKMTIREALFRRLRERALAGGRRAIDLQQKILAVASAAQPPDARPVDTTEIKRKLAEMIGLHLEGDRAEATDVE